MRNRRSEERGVGREQQWNRENEEEMQNRRSEERGVGREQQWNSESEMQNRGSEEKETIREDHWNRENEMQNNMQQELRGIPYLMKYRGKLPDFSNHEIIHCVKIMPDDIGYMNRRNWEYGNNSFVMHGYYNYHYLLLGLMQFQDGKRQHVLGVPGIFSNKDKYLANIFRFTEFVPVRNCPYRTGEFGYWIAKLED